MATDKFTPTGRRKLPNPCGFGHTTQSMECPSCDQVLHGLTAANTDEAWWSWFRKRYGKKA